MRNAFTRVGAAGLLGLLPSGCKVVIEVPEGGTVVSVSGDYQCAAGSTCSIDVSDLLFDQTFEAVADAGYTFAGWRTRNRGLCGGSTASCRLYTYAFENNVVLLSFLESDEVFYLDPLIRESSLGGVGRDYSDLTFNSQASLSYTSECDWTCTDTRRELIANGIPDQEVGEFPNANNPNTIAEQVVSASFTLEPQASTDATDLGAPRGITGYVLNGVKIDADTAGSCDDSGTACSLIGNTGNWSIEALGQNSFNFGTDSNNAHVQPGGAYHYHGMPEGFVAKQGGSSSSMTLIGWAADGFPIYARYGYRAAGDASSGLKLISGSYRLSDAISTSRPSVDAYPLGTCKEDWEYVAGSGDLDECNGSVGVKPEFPQGIYHYYATDSYPYFQRCVKGVVDSTGESSAPPPFGP
ncbi:MAG: hypothetical protein ACI87W_000314 [Halieaceae bacterium]|jgi:hypothetical protein